MVDLTWKMRVKEFLEMSNQFYLQEEPSQLLHFYGNKQQAAEEISHRLRECEQFRSRGAHITGVRTVAYSLHEASIGDAAEIVLNLNQSLTYQIHHAPYRERRRRIIRIYARKVNKEWLLWPVSPYQKNIAEHDLLMCDGQDQLEYCEGDERWLENTRAEEAERSTGLSYPFVSVTTGGMEDHHTVPAAGNSENARDMVGKTEKVDKVDKSDHADIENKADNMESANKVDQTDNSGKADKLVVRYGGYDRYSAATYADQYWNSYNSAFPNFEVDCTNFVSQCLYAGGIPMIGQGNRNRGWWMNDSGTNWSYSWAVANSLYLLLHSGQAPMYAQKMNSPDQLNIGDIICYDFKGEGRFGHNTIVVKKDANGMPLVNAHTYNSSHRYWEYRDSPAYTSNIKYAFFHIRGTAGENM